VIVALPPLPGKAPDAFPHPRNMGIAFVFVWPVTRAGGENRRFFSASREAQSFWPATLYRRHVFVRQTAVGQTRLYARKRAERHGHRRATFNI